MRATFWTLAAIIAATASLTNAVNIAGDASTAIDSDNMNFAETSGFASTLAQDHDDKKDKRPEKAAPVLYVDDDEEPEVEDDVKDVRPKKATQGAPDEEEELPVPKKPAK